jgi:hypothetical protein
MGKPDFILIGETKCGTTSMYNYLKEHPKVLETFGNGEDYDPTYASKELRFFDKFYNRGWDWYFSCFPETKKDECTGEATPMYMYRTLIAKRIKERLPDVKLIVMLRNPVDRLISNFQHNYKWVPGWKEQYPDIKTYFYGCMDKDYYQIEKSIYYYSLQRWFEHFPKSQFCIVRSEDMYENPAKAYYQVTRFLNLPDKDLKDYPVYRANIYNHIDPDFRKELEGFYHPYTQRLEQLIDRKMNWINE